MPPPAPLENVLGYFPAKAAAVVAVPTDLRGEQFRAFDRTVSRSVISTSAERLVRALLEEDKQLSYGRDVRPLLGNHLVAGAPTQRALDGDRDVGFLAALQVRDPLRLRGLVRRIRTLRRGGSYKDASLYVDRDLDMAFALRDDVLLVADGRFALRRAIRQHARSDRLTEARFDEALDGLPRDALIRGYGDLAGMLAYDEDIRRLRALPWVGALRTSGFAAKFIDNRLHLDFVLRTDPAKVADTDLPFPPGDAQAPLFRRDRQILGGSADQSRTTVFLLRAVRVGYPGSRFVRHVARIEQELGINFEDEVLRQFSGPSSSVLGLDGRFAARSTVVDPARLGQLLDRLAPRLPQLVQDLNRIDTTGLSLLLLFAPDAPVAAERIKGPRVQRLPGPGQLYRMSGLRHGKPPPQNPEAVPPVVVFGLLDGDFVVASDERRARRIKEEPASPVEGLSGASVTRASLGHMRRAIKRFLGFDLGRLGEMRGGITASRERLRGTLSIEFR